MIVKIVMKVGYIGATFYKNEFLICHSLSIIWK